jgi:hypothetical protein
VERQAEPSPIANYIFVTVDSWSMRNIMYPQLRKKGTKWAFVLQITTRQDRVYQKIFREPNRLELFLPWKK